jgi:hypothetical protein
VARGARGSFWEIRLRRTFCSSEPKMEMGCMTSDDCTDMAER